uniref:Uncharacterized protein n=1 Tax=Tanacetum cinerariifolium TaxID=118510 RepID=A0A699HQH7_TANCI|nr:hypothetical protein [Tanacetum cinerariifolium]
MAIATTNFTTPVSPPQATVDESSSPVTSPVEIIFNLFHIISTGLVTGEEDSSTVVCGGDTGVVKLVVATVIGDVDGGCYVGCDDGGFFINVFG